MRVTAEGIALIRRCEGFRATAYRDAVGVWTVGYGHTSMAGPPAVTAGLTVSRAEAEAILARDVESFARGVAGAIRTEINDRQFSALVSFAYNVGLANFHRSSVLKAVNAGDFAAVPRRLQLWTRAGDKVLPGLVTRRAAEAAMFIGEAPAQPPEPLPPEAVPGKPLRRSATALAAALAALAGLGLALAGRLGEAAGGALAGLLLLTIVLAAAWIVRERRRKFHDEGV